MAQDSMGSSHFQVEWGGARLGFSEISGISMSTEIIEYREGAEKEDSYRKIPGLKRYGNIVLKRGITAGDNEFYAWFNTIAFGTVERRDISISLLNANHEPVMSWKIRDAFPVKLEIPSLKANASEIAIESLEIACNGITVENE